MHLCCIESDHSLTLGYFAWSQTHKRMVLITSTDANNARLRQLVCLVCFWYMRPPQFPQQRQQQKHKPTRGTKMMKRSPMMEQTKNPASYKSTYRQRATKHSNQHQSLFLGGPMFRVEVGGDQRHGLFSCGISVVQLQ